MLTQWAYKPLLCKEKKKKKTWIVLREMWSEAKDRKMFWWQMHTMITFGFLLPSNLISLVHLLHLCAAMALPSSALFGCPWFPRHCSLPIPVHSCEHTPGFKDPDYYRTCCNNIKVYRSACCHLRLCACHLSSHKVSPCCMILQFVYLSWEKFLSNTEAKTRVFALGKSVQPLHWHAVNAHTLFVTWVIPVS